MNKLSIDQWKEYLQYDPGLGEFTWTKAPTNRVKVGDKVGTVQKNGYLATKLKGTRVYLHRLAWLLHYGEYPDGQIDHINHSRDDNRIENLRRVSHEENGRNCKMKKNNTSSEIGVCWDRSRNKWLAQVYHNGVHILRKRFNSFEEAVNAKNEAYKLAGFHENHGKFCGHPSVRGY